MTKQRFLGATALSTAAVFAIALAPGVALAQDDAAQAAANATTDTDETSDEPVITVVGSRLGGNTAFTSPDPVTVVDPEVALKEGKFDTASMLQSSPIAAGSTQITAALSSNFVTNGGPGAQTIDLRGLGANRTLVLLNGRRAGPAGTRGAVSSFDLNVLPISLTSNVEILKTGASSVYGSDAIAGVVNIQTRRDFDGINIGANVSVPFESGGESYRINGIWGKTWDRGHLTIAGDYTHQNELARGDRDYLACPEANIYRQDGTRADLIDPRTGMPHCEDLRWGHVWVYNLIDNLQLDGPGGPNTGINTSNQGATVLLQHIHPGETINPPTYGAPAYPGDFVAPPGWFPTGYNAASTAIQDAYHPYVEEQTIIPETDLYTAYVEGSFEITDNVELFGEFLFNRRETYQNGWRQFWNFGLTGDLYGYYPGANYYNFWGGGWGGFNLLSPTAITNHSDTAQDVNYYRGVAGLRGNFGSMSSWKYELYTQYSRSDAKYRTEQILQDAYNTGYFQYSSCEAAGIVTPISHRNCVDIPWTDPDFLAGALTQQQYDFLFDWEEGSTLYTQLTFEGSVNGTVVDLPAGPLELAVGGTIRIDHINDVPGPITQAGNAWGASTSGVTAGKSTTSEVFGEVRIPILADQPFAKEFSLSAGGRMTNVSATRASDGETAKDNGNYTYKLGANWAVNDWIRFRGSYGTSFRAPALFEQFLANETSFPTQRSIDICRQWGAQLAAGNISQRVADNCAADGIPPNHPATGVTATSISSGGLGVLNSETSTAWVVGTILTPQLGDLLGDTRLSVAVDYFDIEVNGEITQLGAANIIFGCYDSENFPNEPLCNLFTRGQPAAPNNINTVRDSFVNIANQRNTGVDVTVQLRHDAGNWGRFSLTGDMTWQIKDKFQLLPGSPVTSDNGEAGSPKWVGDFRLNWETPVEGLSAFYGLNVIGATSNQDDFEDDNGGPCLNSFNTETTPPTPIYGTYCPDLTAPAVFYHNISVTYEFMDHFQITAGINNLLDRHPPRVSVLNGSEISMLGPVIAASQYSFLGRRAFVNLSADF